MKSYTARRVGREEIFFLGSPSVSLFSITPCIYRPVAGTSSGCLVALWRAS